MKVSWQRPSLSPSPPNPLMIVESALGTAALDCPFPSSSSSSLVWSRSTAVVDSRTPDNADPYYAKEDPYAANPGEVDPYANDMRGEHHQEEEPMFDEVHVTEEFAVGDCMILIASRRSPPSPHAISMLP
jgi:hypothetical protein